MPAPWPKPLLLRSGPGLLVGISGLLIGLAFVHAEASQAERIAADAAVLGRAEAVMSSAAISRSNLGVVLALAANPEENAEAAATEARRALEVLNERAAALASLTPEAGTVVVAARQAADAGNLALQSALAGAHDDARDRATEVLGPLERVSAGAIAIRDDAASEISAEQGAAGQLARLASFAVALLAPVLAIAAVARHLRRRQQNALLEAELRRKQDLLRTKNEMVANLSHELRTPLTGIYGFATTMADALSSPAEPGERFNMREITGLIVSESIELTRMVEDLLTAAKTDEIELAFHIEAVSLGSEVETVLDPYRKSGAHFDVDLPKDLAVKADRLRLRQVVRNLVANALRHGVPPFEVFATVEGDRVALEVIDHGSGVSAELEARMFQRFVHEGNDPLQAGSVGLGLSIARMLMEKMGGSLTYRRAGALTIFRAEFPIAEAGEVGWRRAEPLPAPVLPLP